MARKMEKEKSSRKDDMKREFGKKSPKREMERGSKRK